MMPTRPARSLVRIAAPTVALGAAVVAVVASGQAGRLAARSPENLWFVRGDFSQLGAAIERGQLPVELLIVGAPFGAGVRGAIGLAFAGGAGAAIGATVTLPGAHR